MASAPARNRPKKIELLNCRIDKVTQADALEWARYFLSQSGPHQVVTANPLMLLAAAKDPELAEIINATDLVVPESSGVRWASEHVGMPLDSIVPGIDLFQGLCRMACDLKRSVFLLGAKPGVAELTAVKLATLYPGLRIAGTQHGYFASKEEEIAAIARVHEAAPDFLFVALNVPEQEKWIRRNLTALNATVVMGVGGSFDVISGRLRRAPLWMRELGMEWVYRTIQEPWRLKRISYLPVFVWKVLFKD